MFMVPLELLALTAPATDKGGQGSPWQGLVSFLPIVAILVIMYMLMIRPQRKRAKEHREMIEAVKEKDQVVTSGGIHGRVVSAKDRQLVIEVDKGVSIKIDKAAISRVIVPGQQDTGDVSR